MSGELASCIVNLCESIFAPRKDDGTDFGCILIKCNGVSPCLDQGQLHKKILLTHAEPCLFWGDWKGFSN
jgi:hypothetical protein